MTLEPGASVLLRAPGSGALAARVGAVEDTVAELILITPPLRPPVTGDAVELEVVGKRGIVRRDSRIVGHDGRGTVRVDLAAGAATETVQRRNFVRVDCALRVFVRDGGAAKLEFEAITRNVSGGGLLLAGATGLRRGDSAWVAIDLEDGTQPIEVLVTVVREQEDGTRGVHIASISARDEQRLVRFSFARERRARTVREG
jgi:c-di-GMP-binding flagellar brake protein YcgR